MTRTREDVLRNLQETCSPILDKELGLYSKGEAERIAETLPDEVVFDLDRCQGLMERVFWIAYMYRVGQNFESIQLDNAGRRAQLKRLASAADRLAAQLDELDLIVRFGLEGEEGDAEDNLDGLMVSLASLQARIEYEVREGAAKPRRGPRYTSLQKILWTSLIAAWGEFTSEPAGYTWDEINGEYRSPFLTFAQAVMRPLADDFNVRQLVEWIKLGRL